MQNLIIHVTAADILNGERGDCDRCPIALALLWKFDGVDVEVSDLVTVHHDGVTRTYALDGASAAFLVAFNDGDPVAPVLFAFTEMPPKTITVSMAERDT